MTDGEPRAVITKSLILGETFTAGLAYKEFGDFSYAEISVRTTLTENGPTAEYILDIDGDIVFTSNSIDAVIIEYDRAEIPG